jgi:O-antigen/teichoic acid export membrane protein
MSTTSRLISGSAAHWIQIVITVISQLAFVPIYLKYWDASTYGIWIAIQALTGIITTLDYGFHEYLSYEFLRWGHNKPEISKYLWSGIAISLVICVFQIIIILMISYLGLYPFFLGKLNVADQHLIHDVSIALLLQGIIYLLYNCAPGLLFRALAPFGYYPRGAWWNLYFIFISNIAPVIAVLFGANLLTAAIVGAIVSFVLCMPIYFDLFNLLKKEKIIFKSLSWKLGYSNFIRSLAVSGKSLLENLRQQGARVIISPLVGTVGLATFSTMRTGSNITSQGLNTIIYPLMPELMRFLHARDQARSEAAFGTIWLVLVVFMAPAVVILQIFIPPFYHLWTQGKVSFNPFLFAAFSVAVLIYAISQPALAVVKGNNLLKSQLIICLIAFIILLGIIMILVPSMGLSGAGIALIFAEISAMIGYKIAATKWLKKNALGWPKNAFTTALTSIYIASISLSIIIFIPSLKWIALLISLVLFYFTAWKYWKTLPKFVSIQAGKIINKIIPGKPITIKEL